MAVVVALALAYRRRAIMLLHRLAARTGLSHVFGQFTGSEAFTDKYETLAEVQQALRRGGLESCNMIVGVCCVPPRTVRPCDWLICGLRCATCAITGIDFTRSNLTSGHHTFNGKSLHTIASPHSPNPYEQVIDVVGRTLSEFDDDGRIPAFYFGDIATKDKTVAPLHQGQACSSFQDLMQRYRAKAQAVTMSGPTSFAALIDEAVRVVKREKAVRGTGKVAVPVCYLSPHHRCNSPPRFCVAAQFHLLVIIADGQVTCKRATIDAIVRASQYPLSIVMVGVGDGPWDTMKEFDDAIPARRFDNFQVRCWATRVL